MNISVDIEGYESVGVYKVPTEDDSWFLDGDGKPKSLNAYRGVAPVIVLKQKNQSWSQAIRKLPIAEGYVTYANGTNYWWSEKPVWDLSGTFIGKDAVDLAGLAQMHKIIIPLPADSTAIVQIGKRYDPYCGH